MKPPYQTRGADAWRRTWEACLPYFPEGLRPEVRDFTLTVGGDTVKWLWQLHDGTRIETVLMAYPDRVTVCVSTQAGCAMGCVFCATGQMGFARHLSAEEIFEQAVYFARELESRGDRLSNVVLMGMGEPFHNYDASLIAVRRLMSDLGIGARHR